VENSNEKTTQESTKFTKDKFISFVKKIGIVIIGIFSAIVGILLMQDMSNRNRKKEQEAKKNLDNSVEKAKETSNTLQKVTEKAKEDASVAMKDVQTNTVKDRLNELESSGVITRKPIESGEKK